MGPYEKISLELILLMYSHNLEITRICDECDERFTKIIIIMSEKEGGHMLCILHFREKQFHSTSLQA